MKRQILIIPILILILMMNGCQLAKLTTPDSKDTLVGIFVAFEDSFSTEEDIFADNNENVDRCYGTYDASTEQYTFPMKGYYCIHKLEGSGTDAYWTPYISNEITDGKTILNGYDSSGFECTLYYDQAVTEPARENNEESLGDSSVYGRFYEIYETPEKRVYIALNTVTGNFALGGGLSFDKANPKNPDIYFKMKLEGCDPVNILTFTRIGKDGRSISNDTFDSSKNLPDTYQWGEDTEYILVTLTDKANKTSYDIINRENEEYQVHTLTDNYICTSQSIRIE